MLKTLSARVFGGTCFLCRGPAHGLLCAPCEADLPCAPEPACPRCALASPEGAVCGRCIAHAPHYDATLSALAYDFPADALIHALKYRGELALADLLGARLCRRLPAAGRIDLLVPVPLSAARLRRRGYNQAAEIGRTVARVARVPLRVRLCERVADTPPQTELPWAERERNVRGAFRCTVGLGGARVAVVDDVMTTGATLDALARALKSAGAAHVVNLVAARTAPPA
jgi:ComF family protein